MNNSREIELNKAEEGYKNIACIDEVGRGCFAGDVVAVAIIMSMSSVVEGVKDSKKLSQKKRELLYEKILEESIAVGIGKESPRVIDTINIKNATREAMKKAVLDLKDKEGNKIKPDILLIDAEELDMKIPQMSIIKGDDKVYGISCASIIAKVYRDNLCVAWDKKYPGYNFSKNKTYGTREHREAILEKGTTEIHRKSFLRKLLDIE